MHHGGVHGDFSIDIVIVGHLEWDSAIREQETSYVGYGFLTLYDQSSEDVQCPAWHISLIANETSKLSLTPHHQLDRPRDNLISSSSLAS